MCTVLIYYVYINTHTYSIHFENIYMCIFIFIKCILYINIHIIYLPVIYTCMCVHLYIPNKYIQYTHIYYVNKNFYFGFD